VYVAALADSVIARGGKIVSGAAVTGMREVGQGVVVDSDSGAAESFDAIVVATGAWLGRHAKDFGVKRVVQAGRGYSFSVEVKDLPNGPVYFPAARVACTPVGDRLRVAGMMEFRRPEEPLDQRRIAAIVEAARPLLAGADLDHRQDEWVGSRPVTSDGLPLIGATRSPRVFVAGGHGMWGITLGPVTGRLLAEQMVTGQVPAPLRPFAPLR
jgi:D-amino-acid dehydrogenase